MPVRQVLIEGPLQKRVIQGGTKWVSFHFVLYSDGKLAYFKQRGASVPDSVLQLNPDFFIADSGLQQNGFQISDFLTTYYLMSETSQEKMVWMHTIALELDKLKNTTQSSATRAPTKTKGTHAVRSKVAQLEKKPSSSALQSRINAFENKSNTSLTPPKTSETQAKITLFEQQKQVSGSGSARNLLTDNKNTATQFDQIQSTTAVLPGVTKARFGTFQQRPNQASSSTSSADQKDKTNVNNQISASSKYDLNTRERMAEAELAKVDTLFEVGNVRVSQKIFQLVQQQQEKNVARQSRRQDPNEFQKQLQQLRKAEEFKRKSHNIWKEQIKKQQKVKPGAGILQLLAEEQQRQQKIEQEWKDRQEKKEQVTTQQIEQEKEQEQEQEQANIQEILVEERLEMERVRLESLGLDSQEEEEEEQKRFLEEDEEEEEEEEEVLEGEEGEIVEDQTTTRDETELQQQQALEEERRIEEQRKREEEEEEEEERKVAQQKQLEEQRRIVEQKKSQEKQKLDEQKRVEEKRKFDEQKAIEEKKRIEAQKKNENKANDQNASDETSLNNRSKMTAMWEKKASGIVLEQQMNPFSQSFDPTVSAQQVKKDDPNYGRPPPGSKTEARAKAAAEWVDREIDKLIDVIRNLGEYDSNGQSSITFGALFIAYQDISDTLVGILMRAKRRNHLKYDGDMLFQGSHDDIVITLL